MASDNEASCVSDPNFAVICSFLERFGKSCGINYPDIAGLQEMLEDAHEVPQPLIELHIKLLRKARKTVSPEKWERSLVKFCHTYSNQDGWELERFGYKKARIAVKLRLLKVLMEAQFDLNPRFKNEVNKLAAEQLRVEPLGRDKTGLAYWFQLDEECNIRVYREDLDEENWELVARDREGVVSLINALSDGEAGPIPINEDSNSLEISEKPIIDTGQVEESSSPEEDSRLEQNNIANDAKSDDATAPTIVNDKQLPSKILESAMSVENNANDEDESEDEDDEDEEGDEEEASNDDSSKQNSDDDEEDDDEEEEEEEEDEDDEDDSQDAHANQQDNPPTVTSSRIVENLVPQVALARQQLVDKQPRGPWKATTPEVTCVPVTVNLPQLGKAVAPRLIVDSAPKAIETPVITTSPIKLVNIQDLQNPVDDRKPQRDEKYPSKPSIAFQPTDPILSLGKFPQKPIDKLAANLSRIQSEKLEKPGAAKLLEKIAENLARSSGAHGSLVNGDDEKSQQEFVARGLSEKSNSSSLPTSRGQRGMDLTSQRGWDNSNDHGRPMDYSGIDLSSRKSTKPTDIHQAGYRAQEFQHREMDLSTRKMTKPDLTGSLPMGYDPRTVILRNHTMVTDLSKKQMSYPGYDIPPGSAYHNASARIPVKDDHRLPNYTILSDPSKIASMRMTGGPLKRPLEIIDDPQQEMLKRMRADSLIMRGAIDKRTTPIVGGLRRDEVGPAIEEPVMMIHGEGSGSDCDAVNPIVVGEAIEEQVIFFYGDGAGRDCEMGNPGDETSSDNKESNESKNEGCSDVSTSLTPTRISPADGGVNNASSTDPTRSSPLKINANYSQSSSNSSGATDNCQSTVVSSVSPKSKFKPTLGVQVIAKSSGSPGKKLSRWDVRRAEGKSEECDSSIVSGEEHVSPADEIVVENKTDIDCITSTSNQNFLQIKIAECSSSVDENDDVDVPKDVQSSAPDSSFATSRIPQCDSSVATSSSVESTVREEDFSVVEASVKRKSDETGEPSGSPPRFFFGPNCVSYTSKDSQSGANQSASTSVTTSEPTRIECSDVAKNNNNFVKIADTCNSESSDGSCEINVDTRSRNVEVAEREDKPDSASTNERDEAALTECRVQSSTSSGAKDETDSIATSEVIVLPSVQTREEKINEGHQHSSVSVDTTDRLQAAESSAISESNQTYQSHSSDKSDLRELEAKAESTAPHVSLPVPETMEISEVKVEDESKKICEAETSSSVSGEASCTETEAEEKKLDEPHTGVEREENTCQTVDSNDPLPLSESNEGRSFSLQETPDDSCQTIETVDEKPEESNKLDSSSDVDDKTKQSTESEEDSLSVVKNNKEKTNELCNEDAQDGFSKSSELVEEAKNTNSESLVNVSKAQSELLSLDDKSITSVELPEDSSGDSVAASSASLLVNPSGGEDSVTSDREVGETLSVVESSAPSPVDEIQEGPPADEVTPAVIVDSNISKSPERITIASEKPSSSARLLDALDTYADDLSENPSSADQDSNEAMVIDDGASDSHESTNFRDKVQAIIAPVGESVKTPAATLKIEDSSYRDDPDTTLVNLDIKRDGTENIEETKRDSQTTPDDLDIEKADGSENIEDPKSDPQTTLVNLDIEKADDFENIEETKSDPRTTLVKLDIEKPDDSEKIEETKSDPTPVEIREEVEPEAAPVCSKIYDTSETAEMQEKSVESVKSSLVPNYDCSDEDDVSDDVFEEKITIEKSIVQTESKIMDESAEVSESKSAEVDDKKKGAESLASELNDTLIEEEPKAALYENNKDFSEAEFHNEDNDDSRKKLDIDAGEFLNKSLDRREDNIEDREKLAEPDERIETAKSKETLVAIEESTDGASKITVESCDLSDDVVSTSETHEEKSNDTPGEAIVVNDSRTTSEVLSSIDTESKKTDRATGEEVFTQENSKLNEVVPEAAFEEKNIESRVEKESASNREDVENTMTKETDDSKKNIEPDSKMTLEASKPEVDVVDSASDETEPIPDVPDKTYDTTNTPAFKDHEVQKDSKIFHEKSELSSESLEREEETSPLPAKCYDLHKSFEPSVTSEVPVNLATPQVPEKISAKNALPEVDVSGPSEEKISNSSLINLGSNRSESRIDYSSDGSKEIRSPHDSTQSVNRAEISDAASHKSESKKEASKRLHGASDGDDFPPTKSKPPNVDFANEKVPDYRSTDEKSTSDDKIVVARSEVSEQVAFDSSLTSGDAPSTLGKPEVDVFDKVGNHDVEDIRENFVKPTMQTSIDEKSSEIHSVDIKCVDLESDDSMGIDNESMFDTAADDVDPLACTEEELKKPAELVISSVPKIGIRVKPVEDLVYEGWKLDSPEPPAPPTVSRKRRNSAHESNSEDGTIKLDDGDSGETGGKRMKLRGKRSPDMKLRKSVEQSRPEPMSSEDEATKARMDDDVVELKQSGETLSAIEKARNDRKPRGRPRGKRRRGNRAMARVTRTAKSTEAPATADPVEAGGTVVEDTKTVVPAEHGVEPAPGAGQVESKKKRKKRKMVLGLEVGIDIAVPDSQTGQDEVPVRQSRRIAQLKIKEEADKRRIEEETLGDMKEKKHRDGTEKKKRKKQKPESDDEQPVVVVKEIEREVKIKKHRKKKKFSAKEFNEANPWQSSSGSSTSDEEGPEDEDDEDIESEGSLLFKSDHEFSPESDLEKDDESEPLRRARTAQKATSDVEEAEDEYACQKCGKADHPEWILLCDTCDKGWHCSCLRPALMLIPEGDWFCPPCQHTVLVTKLRDSLKIFDQNSKKHENEVLRKKRLAFVGISLDNVIHKTEAGRGDRSSSRESDNDSSSSSSESSSSSSSSEDSEPVYQLRERRCASTYKFNEYDDMINAAIQDEVEAVQGAGNQGRGKDIATIVNAEKEEAQAEALKNRQLDDEEEDEAKKSEKDSDEDYKVDKEEADEDEEETARKTIVKKTLSRKKHRKLNSLDISSEDDPESDEDFKGSSSDEDEDFEDQMYSSDDSYAQSRRRGRRGESRPVRRSTRAARKTRYDEDFINDDSDDSDRPKRKKSRSVWEGSESEDSDNSWRQRKKKSKTVPAPRLRATSKTKLRKKKKRRRIIEPDNASDNEEEVEAQHEDVDEKEEETEAQPSVAEAELETENVPTNENVRDENHEEEQLEKEENPESPNADEERPKKKKKESTPKQKKAPVIRRKIVYGGLDDDGPRQEEETLARRTRGRKINYQDIMGSDSEEELKKVLRKTEESEDEFVVNEGEDFNEDAEKDSDSGDIYSPKKELPKGKAKSPKNKKPKTSKSPGGRKSLTDNGTPKERKKPGPKPGSKNRPRQSSLSIAPDPKPKDTDSITRGLDMEGSTMSATGSVIGEVPEGSLTGLTPEDINALDDEQIEQMMMEDEEYGRRQLELAAIEIARNKKQEEREAKKLEKARLKALEILAAEQQRDPNAPEGTDGEAPKKKKRGRRSKAEILAEQMRRDGVPSLLPGSMIPAAAVVVQELTTNQSTNLTTNVTSNPTLPTVVSSIETDRSPESGVPLMTVTDGQVIFSPDGSPMKPKRRGRGKGKKTLALEAARAAEAAAKAAAETGGAQIGITGTETNPEVKHDDIPNVLPTPGSSTSGSAPPTPPASSVVAATGHQPAQSPNQQQTTVYPSLPTGQQQSSVITRMLQSQPVSNAPQSFTAAAAAMGHKYFGGPNTAGQIMAGPRPSNYEMPPRGRIPSPYRQPGPSPMPPHFAAIRSGAPPMRMRGPGPQLYHTPHHPMDPSPSGGGPISINSRDRSSPLAPGPSPAMIPPAAGSPLAKGGPTPPPPPYARGGPALARFTENPQLTPRHQVPPFTTPSPANHNMQQPSPPPNRPPGNFSPYHPPPPPNYHYGAYPPPPPMTTADDAAAYQGSPYSAEHFSTPAESQPQIQQPPPPPQPQPGPPQPQVHPHPNETSGPVNKQYDEEGTGEFGGLVSYFSSQREDDLDS